MSGISDDTFPGNIHLMGSEIVAALRLSDEKTTKLKFDKETRLWPLHILLHFFLHYFIIDLLFRCSLIKKNKKIKIDKC